MFNGLSVCIYVFLIFQSAGMGAPGRTLLASPSVSPLWSLGASSVIPEFVGRKGPDAKVKQVNMEKAGNQDFSSSVSLHQWI